MIMERSYDENIASIGKGKVKTAKRCKAKTRTGLRCKNPAVRNRDICRMHGGAQKTGVENQKFKHGMYSKYLNNEALEAYEEILHNKDLMSLTEEVAVLKMILAREIEDAQNGGSPRTWLNLNKRWGKFMSAVQDGDTEKQMKLLIEIDEYIRDGARIAEAEREIKSMASPLTRLIKTHNDIMVSREQMMPMDQVMALLGLALQGFREAVYAKIERQDDVHAIMYDAGKRFEHVIKPKAITKK